jgi:hypothetical protein
MQNGDNSISSCWQPAQASAEVTGLLKLLLEEYSAALAKAKEVADE